MESYLVVDFLNFWQFKSNATWLVQILEAMSDLHFTHRSGSDRGWLPVWGEERLTSCWEMADMKGEMIMSIEHSLNECLLFSPTLIQSVFQYYFPWSPTLLSSLLDWSPYIFLSPPLSSLFSFTSYTSFHILSSSCPTLPDTGLSPAKVMGYPQAVLAENKGRI